MQLKLAGLLSNLPDIPGPIGFGEMTLVERVSLTLRHSLDGRPTHGLGIQVEPQHGNGPVM